MSAYPLMLDGEGLRALVVGGGTVAVRKARALLEAGATVTIVAPRIDAALEALASARLKLCAREYAADVIEDALLVIAATSSRDVNARVARDALSRGRLVNVVDEPSEGNCVTPATHRAGDLLIAVSAGGVPGVAARVRDAIAARYSDAYADAIEQLRSIRTSLLPESRSRWAEVADDVVGADFCESVERGDLAHRIAAWR